MLLVLTRDVVANRHKYNVGRFEKQGQPRGIPNPQGETQRFRNIKGYGDGHHYYLAGTERSAYGDDFLMKSRLFTSFIVDVANSCT